ncbi:MAG: sugar ABC transporter substrate-binding protein [Caldilineaceae bacterium]|nr:sugar ABC transporter substrate-binding protein [Caldilineaceae bacterium]
MNLRFRSVMPAIALVLVVSMLLTACVPVAQAPAAPPAAAGEQVKLTFWHHTYTVATDWMQGKIAEYQAMNPNVEIELVEYPHGDYEVKLLAAISAGNPPDIINLLDYLFPKYYDKGLLAPVDPAAFGVADQQGVIDLFEKPALDGMTFDGNVYGVPAEFNTFVIFANGSHFQEIGLDPADPAVCPATWDDFFALAKQLEQRDASGNLTRLGFNWVWGLDLFWYAQQYWSGMRQYGCEVIGPDGQAAINSPACVQMFEETWYKLITEGMGGPALATPNPVYAFQDFMDGRQSMVIGGPWAPAAWRENAPDVYENYFVCPHPQLDPANPKSFIHTYALGVSAGSQNASEAWKFLDYLLADPGEMYAAAGYINGRTGWLDSPEVQASKGLDVMRQDYENGAFVWRSSTFTEEGEAIKNAIETFVQDGNVQGALDKAAEEINAARSQ